VTEAEWLACEDPITAVAEVSPHATDRKLRLFLCACCGRVLDGTPPERRLFRGYYAGSFEQLQRALGVVEQFAEGEVGADALAQARRDAKDSEYVPPSVDYGGETEFWREVAAVIVAAADHPVVRDVLNACRYATMSQSVATPGESVDQYDAERRWQTAILRDVFGNPFRPVTFDPRWRTESAVALARRVYAERDFSLMPILSDALQDAGCENADLLAHCRGAGPHVRGCWVLDHVLGKM
jgi:hypothetical protein